jgi:hypothetical protein
MAGPIHFRVGSWTFADWLCSQCTCRRAGTRRVRLGPGGEGENYCHDNTLVRFSSNCRLRVSRPITARKRVLPRAPRRLRGVRDGCASGREPPSTRMVVHDRFRRVKRPAVDLDTCLLVRIRVKWRRIVIQNRQAGETPAVQCRQAGETPAVQCRQAGETPAVQCRQAGETPAVQCRQAGETPAVQKRRAGEMPVVQGGWGARSDDDCRG